MSHGGVYLRAPHRLQSKSHARARLVTTCMTSAAQVFRYTLYEPLSGRASLRLECEAERRIEQGLGPRGITSLALLWPTILHSTVTNFNAVQWID